MSGKSVVTVVDKRTIHTDALDILGRVITEDDKVGRDAIMGSTREKANTKE